MKHDPNLIIEIANRLKHLKFLIIAFGNGYDSLKRNDKLPKNIYLFQFNLSIKLMKF